MHELKQCPFCGSPARLTSVFSRKSQSFGIYGKCDFCDAQAKVYWAREDDEEAQYRAADMAASAWNSRK